MSWQNIPLQILESSESIKCYTTACVVQSQHLLNYIMFFPTASGHTHSQPTTLCYLMGSSVNGITTWSKSYLEAYTFLTQTARNISFTSTDTPLFPTVNTAENCQHKTKFTGQKLQLNSRVPTAHQKSSYLGPTSSSWQAGCTGGVQKDIPKVWSIIVSSITSSWACWRYAWNKQADRWRHSRELLQNFIHTLPLITALATQEQQPPQWALTTHSTSHWGPSTATNSAPPACLSQEELLSLDLRQFYSSKAFLGGQVGAVRISGWSNLFKFHNK